MKGRIPKGLPPSTWLPTSIFTAAPRPFSILVDGMLGRIIFWLCVTIGVLAGGMLLLIDDLGIRIMGLFFLGGMVLLGLVLRRVFGGGED